jgi:citrate lyase subunit beta/citryl-CoA lyase
MNHPARSYLFVPGHRPERFDKAIASAADVVVIDLEDAVDPEAKADSRGHVASWTSGRDARTLARVALRINDAGSEYFGEDLRLVRDCAIRRIMLPKAEHADQVARVLDAQADALVLPLLETARGLDACGGIAAARGVQRLVFGTLDFAFDLELDLGEDLQPLAEAAAQIVRASRVAGLQAPVAGVTPQLRDEARLSTDWSWFRRRGFGAKLCIHPCQVGPVHEGLAPDAEAVDWARRVVAVDAQGAGAASVDGRMVDRPVVLQALRILRRAGL